MAMTKITQTWVCDVCGEKVIHDGKGRPTGWLLIRADLKWGFSNWAGADIDACDECTKHMGRDNNPIMRAVVFWIRRRKKK